MLIIALLVISKQGRTKGEWGDRKRVEMPLNITAQWDCVTAQTRSQELSLHTVLCLFKPHNKNIWYPITLSEPPHENILHILFVKWRSCKACILPLQVIKQFISVLIIFRKYFIYLYIIFFQLSESFNVFLKFHICQKYKHSYIIIQFFTAIWIHIKIKLFEPTLKT